MSDFDKGYNQGSAKPGNYEQQQGVWARQQEQRREQEAAEAASRERDERTRRALLEQSSHSPIDVDGGTHSPRGPYTPIPFKKTVSRTALFALACTAFTWFVLLDLHAGPDMIGVLAGGYFGGAVLGAGLWALGWIFHYVGIALRIALKYTIATAVVLAIFYLLTGRLPF